MEQKWNDSSNPFGAFKPQSQPEVELKAPDVKQVLDEIKPKDEHRYCSLCGLQVEACQHLNGVHHGNTYDSIDEKELGRIYNAHDREFLRQQALGIKRQCGCF